MIGSLYSGISGLKANTDAMSVIGDNIANVNTTGFKSSKASFADVFSQVAGKDEIGQGVMISEQSTDWTQGAPESTGNATDLTITGDGLFIVHDDAGAEYYTRAGNFQFDNAGNLVNHDGMIVQGYKIDPVAGVSGAVSNITIESGSCPPLVTSEMSVNLNLNAGDTNGLDESAGATLTVDCAKANSDVIFTAISGGSTGNDISVKYVDPGAVSQVLSVDVAGNAITVNLATDGDGAITSTAAEIAAKIEEVDTSSAELVTAAVQGSGAGVVNAATYFSGGGIGTKAELTVDCINANSDVIFTAINEGTAGNNISVKYVDPSAADQALSVDVVGNAITVNLATDNTGAITSTAVAIADFISDDTSVGAIAARALVSAAEEGDGTGIVNIATDSERLSGGGGGAELTVDCTNTGSDVTYTAVNGGTSGNDISIKYVDPGAVSQALSVDVAGNAITVNLATDSTGAITSTADEIAAAVNFNVNIALLVAASAEGNGIVEAKVLDNLSGGVEVADNTPDTYFNTITAYDSKGSAVDVTVRYTCVNQGRWVWDVTASDGLSSSTDIISFDENGKLNYPATNPTIEITGLSNGADDLKIKWDLVDNDNFTGYALASSTSSQIQNGYAAGSLQSVSVDDEGFVVKTYSNGKFIPGYQITLAGFSNYSGLDRAGGNLYAKSLVSGQPIFGTPGSGSLGGINSSSLEMSNVDLAKEFVRMITTQRAFQANSRVITSSDEILQELINLKR